MSIIPLQTLLKYLYLQADKHLFSLFSRFANDKFRKSFKRRCNV